MAQEWIVVVGLVAVIVVVGLGGQLQRVRDSRQRAHR
jgi:type II secretory pathway pseudopilin PulG